MSAQPHSTVPIPAGRAEPPLQMSTMSAADLDEVAAIEQCAYAFPWSRGNFEDSLRSGYTGLCMRDQSGRLLGYSILMPAVDEAHLLNFCVAPAWQRQGLGARLLSWAIDTARASGFNSLLLEVRASNANALRLYERFGFNLIGRRKHYYPAPGRSREDALVMRLTWPAASFSERLHDAT
jgi:[ribosomal protein S18]-alanine N-acetyltransferase